MPGKIRRNSLPELLQRIDSGVGSGPRDEAVMVRTVKIVDLLLSYRPLLRYGKCFLRSLTLFKFLRLQGWPVSICFGVRRSEDDDSGITGHSWLVYNGKPFLEGIGIDTYAITFRYPEE
ncbi:MAG: lasso peptide biosynthesis B2 protein [Thermoleophilia bacterium]